MSWYQVILDLVKAVRAAKEKRMKRETTVFGRKKEVWESDRGEFCKRGNLSESMVGRALYRLSDEEFAKVTAAVDPAEDTLTSINLEGFTVKLGSREIEYSF